MGIDIAPEVAVAQEAPKAAPKEAPLTPEPQSPLETTPATPTGAESVGDQETAAIPAPEKPKRKGNLAALKQAKLDKAKDDIYVAADERGINISEERLEVLAKKHVEKRLSVDALVATEELVTRRGRRQEAQGETFGQEGAAEAAMAPDEASGWEGFIGAATKWVGERDGGKVTPRMLSNKHNISIAQAERLHGKLRSDGALTAKGYAPKKRTMPRDILDIIKSMGGIQRDGDLDAMDLRIARPGIVVGQAKGGRTVHEIREHLEEIGMIPEGSYDDTVYDLIRQALARDANRPFHPADADLVQAMQDDAAKAENALPDMADELRAPGTTNDLEYFLAAHDLRFEDEEIAEIMDIKRKTGYNSADAFDVFIDRNTPSFKETAYAAADTPFDAPVPEGVKGDSGKDAKGREASGEGPEKSGAVARRDEQAPPRRGVTYHYQSGSMGMTAR